ncbi:MAG: TolC family protein [Aureliella sp.]
MKLRTCALLALLATVVPSEYVWSQALESPGISRRLTDDGRVLPESKLPPLPALPAGFIDVMTAEADPQFAPTYTLESVLATAAANNPTIRQARLQISAETAKALQAGLYPNPLLMYVGEKINSSGTAGEFQGFEVQQRFVTAGKLQLSRLKYRQRAHVAEHLAIAQQYRVSNDIQRHFYTTLAAMDRVALQRELVKTAEDEAVTSREMFNQGQANLPNVRQANVVLQQRRLDLLNTQNEYNEAFRKLSAVVGCPMEIGIVTGSLRPEVALPAFEMVYADLIETSPEVLAAKAKLAADQTTVQRESVQWVPDIVVQGGPGYNFTNYDPVYNASVRLELPVFDRNQGTIMQAQRDMQRQIEEIRRTELVLRERLAMAYRLYATSLQHATQYEQVVIPERKAAYTELLQSYKDNRIDWEDVLHSQQDFFMARLEQINQFRDVRIQEVMIDGYLLEGGLMAAQSSTPPGHIDAVPKPR